MRIAAGGDVGISTGIPQARLDVMDDGSAATDMAQIWRNASGVIQGSMSATGVMMATKFIGDGSGLIGGDNLGNHVATTTLRMGAYGINTSSDISAARYQISGSTVLAILPGTGSMAVGSNAGANSTANYATLVGFEAGLNNGGTDNTSVGYRAGYSNTGILNTFVGLNAGNANTSAGANVFMGARAGQLNTTGGDNIYVGAGTGQRSIGSQNTYIGRQAGSFGTDTNYHVGSQNVFVGYRAAVNSGNGNNNVVIGAQAAYNKGTLTPGTAISFSSSVVLGWQSGYNLDNGADKNLMIGFQAGYNITTGTGNIVLGADQDTSVNTANNELNIGGTLFGDLKTRTIGISTRAPQAALDVVSTGTSVGEMAQLWRNASGVIQGSMSATGVMMATKFIGDGSGLTNLSGDNLGNHVATTTLNMGAYGVNTSSNITAGNLIYSGTVRSGAASEPGRWRFYDASGYLMSFWTTGGDSDTWGLYWDTSLNKLVWRGSGTDRASVDLDDGAGYFQGSVGMGTASPQVKLDVTGSPATYVTGTEDEFHLTRLTQSGVSWAQIAAFKLGTWNTSGACCGPQTRLDIDLKAAVDGNLTGDTNVMTLLSNGRVGIGATAPLSKLDVRGQGTFSVNSTSSAPLVTSSLEANLTAKSLITLGENTAGSANPAITLYRTTSGWHKGTATRIYQPSSQGQLYFQSGTYDTDYGSESYTTNMAILRTGQVGIADTTPDAQFEVLSNSAPSGYVVAVSSQNDTTGGLFAVLGNGNVGIGRTSPAGKLDVQAVGSDATDMAQIWRNSGGTIQSSMSATGVMMATKFIGDGSGLTGVSGSDNLGNHVATATLNMKGFDVVNVGSISFNSASYNVSISSAGADKAYGLYVSTHIYARGVGRFDGTGSYSSTIDTRSDVGLVTMQGKYFYFDSGGSIRRLIGVGANGSIEIGESPTALISSITLRAGSAGFISMGGGSGAYTEAMRVAGSGNVGVSSSTPQYRLTISSGAGESGVLLAVSTGSSTMFSVKGTGEITGRKLTLEYGQSRIYNSAGDITIEPAGTNLTVSKNVSAPSFTGSLAPGYITAGALGNSVIASSIAVGAVIGPNIVASTITLDKLNQSGCSVDDMPKWNGTRWACAPGGSNDYYADELSLHLDLPTHTFSAKSSSVTLLGNTFNGANQLLQLDGSGLVPDADIPSAVTRDTEWDTWAELPALANAHILVGNGSADATDVAMSGDITINSSGVTAIGSGKVLTGMISDGTIIAADIANSTISINKLNQSGCGTNQTIKWNGSTWVCSDFSTAGGSDDLGDHVATKTVNMAGWDMTGISTITFKANVYLSSASSAQYGGIYVSTNLWVAGPGNLVAGYAVQDKGTDPGTVNLTTADFGKTFISTGTASTTLYNLPSVGAADIGAQFRFVKLGPGKVTIDAPAGVYIADSGSGGTIYNDDTTETYATITLHLVKADRWAITGGDGSWTTTN